MGRDGVDARRDEGVDARGRAAVDPARDFHHTFLYQMDYRGSGKPGLLRRYAGSERNYRIMIDNDENPYTTSPDTCIGGDDRDASAAARCTGRERATEWPTTSSRRPRATATAWTGPSSYADMKPYYDRVESFIGVSGAAEGLPQFPDGMFLPAMPLNCAETIFTAACKRLGWPSTHRRLAQLTRMHNNRPPCHYCGNCVNGCDVGAMFSTDRGDAAVRRSRPAISRCGPTASSRGSG